jgi:hypothetical protein
MAMDIVFLRKKQNSNRAKGVGVVSILTKVKHSKSGFLSPNCTFGLRNVYSKQYTLTQPTIRGARE